MKIGKRCLYCGEKIRGRVKTLAQPRDKKCPSILVMTGGTCLNHPKGGNNKGKHALHCRIFKLFQKRKITYQRLFLSE